MKCAVSGSIAILLMSFLVQDSILAQEVRPYQARISLSQEKEIIAIPADIAVMEDESFIISDFKDQKIMVFDRNGTHLKSWKNVGQGPGEYQGLWWIDYCQPHLGVYDLRVQKLILYRREGAAEFRWIKDIRDVGNNVRDVKLTANRLYCDGLSHDEGQPFCIMMRELEATGKGYFLPAAVRFGLNPGEDYLGVRGDYGLWGTPWSFLDVYEGHIYSTWNGRLEVLKINASTKNWVRIGTKTKHYTQPKILKGWQQDLKRATAWKKKNEARFSWTTGVFVDRGMIGVMYLNHNDDSSGWETILQLYSAEGKLRSEEKLAGARAIYSTLKYDYSRDSGVLFVLIMTEQDSGEVDFEVLKYRIRE